MNITTSSIRNTSSLLFKTLIVFELIIVFIYLGSIFRSGIPYAPFDMNGQMTVSSWLQALHLLAIGLISLGMFFYLPRKSAPPSRKFLLTIAVLLIYGCLDEIFKIHLKLHHFLPLEERDWFGIYFGLVVSIPIFFYRDFIGLWKGYRLEFSWGILGLFIFILGGFGADILNQFVLKPLLGMFSNPESLVLLANSAKIAFEEFAELLGETFILYGVLLFVAKKLKISERQGEHSPVDRQLQPSSRANDLH
ncbi:MAG: hypothetical protein SWY16_04840 [Cyanobacteriota bacterium]|nr:hypothetical protein [Cyanobacteriota bacterium]